VFAEEIGGACVAKEESTALGTADFLVGLPYLSLEHLNLHN